MSRGRGRNASPDDRARGKRKGRRAATPRKGGADGKGPAAPIPAAPDPTPDPYDGSTPLPLPKRERWAQEMMVDDNATQSALRSGYGPGYGSAQVTGSRLLSDAMCQARIAYLRAERAKRLGLDADRIIQHAAAIAFSDIGDVLEHTRRLDEEGNAVPEPRPQVACTNCQGRGWFNGPAPDHGHRECGHCGGTGKVADERWEPTNAQVARGLWPLRNWEDIPPHARIAIQEFTDTESANGTKRRGVKFHPKQPALQMLAQIAKLLVARMSVENPDGTNLIPPIPATQEGQERALAEIIARGLGRAPG